LVSKFTEACRVPRLVKANITICVILTLLNKLGINAIHRIGETIVTFFQLLFTVPRGDI
jgi:hypothetical protein